MKILCWATCMVISVVNIVLSVTSKDENDRQHCLTRALTYNAACLVILSL